MLRQAAAAALAGTGLLLATGPNAQATQRRAALLPQIGQTVHLEMSVFGATLAVPLPPPLPRLNFIGSMVVKVLIGGASFVRLQTLNFTMQSFHPLLGNVTLKLPDIDVAPASILAAGPDGGLRHTWIQSMDMTFERFGDLTEPLTFETTQPAKASGTLPAFPPPPQGTNPDGSPTGGAFLTAADPIHFKPKNPLPVGLPLGLSAVQLQWDGVNEGQLLA